MPWSTNSALPAAVRSSLPEGAQSRWRSVANDALSRGASDASAARQAWHVVRQGWKKDKDGNWVRIEKRADGKRTLYVRRDVVNAGDIVNWAKAQGFETTLPADDMHVTIAYSKKPVEWSAMGDHFDNLTIKGGRRGIAEFDKGAVVLRFTSDELHKRWQHMIDKGAVWKWDEYQPHVTITYDAPGDLDVSKVEAYTGEIVLGPEIFEEIDKDWHDNITEKVWYETVHKVGARHTRGEYEQLQQMHDLSVSLGAKCGDEAMKAVDGEAVIEYRRYDKDGKEIEKSDDDHVFFKATLTKFSEPLGLVFGWGIICKQDGEPYFDLQGDHIPEDAMLSAAADFMANSRMAKDMHAGDPIGSVVFCWPLTGEIAKAMDIESKQTGMMVAMKPSPEILEKFRSGEYTGFSIGGSRLKDEAAE